MKIENNTLDRIVDIAKSYGANRLIVFGSAIEDPESAHDLDLACDGVEGWKFFELGAKIENELRVSIDLVPLSPSTRFTQYIESKGKRLL